MAISQFKDFRKLGTPTSKKDALEFAKKAEATAKRYDETWRVVSFDIARAKDKMNQQLSGFKGGALDAVRGPLNEEYTQARRTILKNSEKARYEKLAELKNMLDTANAAAELFQNPLAYLSVQHIGDHRRSRLIQELSTQGPAGLRSVAQVAASTGDVELAAAVLIVNESREGEQQGFSSHALAEQMVGEECESALDYLRLVDRLYHDARNTNTALERGRPNSLGLIAEGLKDRQSPVEPLPDEAA